MAEYIERSKIGLTDFEIILCKGDYKEALKMLLDKIETLPAADVRPVVLCRDCKSYNRPRLGFCETHLIRMHGDDFCSYGKRREES